MSVPLLILNDFKTLQSYSNPMKHLFPKLIALFAFLTCFSIASNAQNKVIGKTYTAKYSEICKDRTDGGCMIYTWRVLAFEKDSVVVSYRTEAHCTPKEIEQNYEHMYDELVKSYKWTAKNNTITIQEFNEYGDFTFQNNKLTGKQKSTNDEWVPVEFTEDKL